jgi:hypothetical protein
MNKKNEVLATEMHFVLILFNKSFEFLHIFILITLRCFSNNQAINKKIIFLSK